MLLGLPPIFVAGTKAICGYNFVAPLNQRYTSGKEYLIT